MKVIDYKLLSEEAHLTLMYEVNLLIREGWQPLGVPFLREYGNYKAVKWIQAMVKYEEVSTDSKEVTDER